MSFDLRRLLRRGWTETRSRPAAPLDPRIPVTAYEAAETYGRRLSALMDGVYDACPHEDVLRAWDRLPAAHRALFVVYWAMAETENGSLQQYFSNSPGQLAPLLPDAARFFGAETYAAVFERAIGFFDVERLPDRDYRNERLDELDATGQLESFDRLTDELDALEDVDGSIYVAMTQYIDAHPEAFFI